MTEPELYHALLMLLFALAGVTFAVLGLVSAPYGRHARPGWGPRVPERLAWMLVELPGAAVFAVVFFAGPRATDPVPLVMFALWQLHYLYRALVYPWLRQPRPGRGMPLVPVATGLIFTVLVAYLNARWLTALGPGYGLRWLLSFRFLYGALLFLTGLVINRWADLVLRSLRDRGTDAYAIPRGGLFDEISCPNYFGEVVQWLGWAILTWSPAGVVMATFTAANLVPRAVSHHRWYQRRFPDYPRRRRAIIPYVL